MKRVNIFVSDHLRIKSIEYIKFLFSSKLLAQKWLKTVSKHSPSILCLKTDARLNFGLYPTM